MIDIELLEIHAAHGCNLTCDSCSHFSNQGHSGLLTPESADEQMALWSHRINPRAFSILGGEPLLNKNIEQILEVARKHWKNDIYLITNGLLLHRFPSMPETLERLNVGMIISRHHSGTEYTSKFMEMFRLLRTWKKNHDFKFELRDSFTDWTRRYHGYADRIMPFEDDDARASWKACPAKTCRQIHEGNVYKCSPITYLQLQKKKYTISEKWDPYLAYEPLSPSCSDSEMAAFFAREEEPICTMCPARPEPLAISSPLTPFGQKLKESQTER